MQLLLYIYKPAMHQAGFSILRPAMTSGIPASQPHQIERGPRRCAGHEGRFDKLSKLVYHKQETEAPF